MNIDEGVQLWGKWHHLVLSISNQVQVYLGLVLIFGSEFLFVQITSDQCGFLGSNWIQP